MLCCLVRKVGGSVLASANAGGGYRAKPLPVRYGSDAMSILRDARERGAVLMTPVVRGVNVRKPTGVPSLVAVRLACHP
jgi:hypothetical protein